jgi:hypothetical protein
MSAPPRWLALRSIVLRLDVPQYWRDAHYRRHLQAPVSYTHLTLPTKA